MVAAVASLGCLGLFFILLVPLRNAVGVSLVALPVMRGTRHVLIAGSQYPLSTVAHETVILVFLELQTLKVSFSKILVYQAWSTGIRLRRLWFDPPHYLAFPRFLAEGEVHDHFVCGRGAVTCAHDEDLVRFLACLLVGFWDPLIFSALLVMALVHFSFFFQRAAIWAAFFVIKFFNTLTNYIVCLFLFR